MLPQGGKDIKGDRESNLAPQQPLPQLGQSQHLKRAVPPQDAQTQGPAILGGLYGQDPMGLSTLHTH